MYDLSFIELKTNIIRNQIKDCCAQNKILVQQFFEGNESIKDFRNIK